MSQENFDDLLKQSFEKERDIPFDESAWQSLSGRLNNTRGFMLPLWSILLLSFGWLTAAGLGIFIMSSYPGYAIPAEHSSAIGSSSALYPCDTIYQHLDTLVIKDTVFIYPSSPNKEAAETNSNTKQAIARTKTKAPAIIQTITPQPLPTAIEDNTLAISTTTETLAPLPSTPIASNIISDKLQVDWLYKTPLPTTISKKPGRFQIGITGGWGNILNEEENVFAALLGAKLQDDALEVEGQFDSVSLQQHLAPTGVLQQGINVSYNLNSYFSAQAEFGQERIGYQYSSNPLSNGFNLVYDAERIDGEIDRLLSQRSLYYEIGFQSQLPKRLSPILHTRLRMRSHLSSITLEEIEPEASANTGAFIVDTSASNERSPSKGLRIEQIRLGAGLQYQISRDWSVQSSFDTYLDVRDDSWVRPDWSLNVGLKYRLPAKKAKP